MLQRKPVFPHVVEMNVQAGERLGCNVYLVFDKNEWVLIDVGYQETVDQIVDLIRQMDFPLSNCKTVIATHGRENSPQSGQGDELFNRTAADRARPDDFISN